MTESPAKRAPTGLVQLPEEIVRGLEERIRGTGFATVDAYVTFVLARLLEEPGHAGFSEQDEQKLRDRLRSLGYID